MPYYRIVSELLTYTKTNADGGKKMVKRKDILES